MADLYIEAYDDVSDTYVFIADPEEDENLVCPPGFWTVTEDEHITKIREWDGESDCYTIEWDDHLCLLIADVSDKGVPAALFMMSSKIMINYRAREGGTPAEILTAVNRELNRNNKSKMFVTVWLGILDIKTGKMICSNAGHEYPFIRRKDGAFCVFEDKHGLMVGAIARAAFTDYELQLEAGDAIFVYTDGVTEAVNAAGEFYGMERLEAALNSNAKEPPQGILEGVRRDVGVFAEGAQQSDDLTMLCLEFRNKAR